MRKLPSSFGQTLNVKALAMAGSLLAVSAASTLALTQQAQAQQTQAQPGQQAQPMPPASAPPVADRPHPQGHDLRGPGGPGGPGMMPFGGHHLDRMLDEVKATDVQRTQIKALTKAAEADLKPLHETGRGLHEKTLDLFAQPQVDAAAAENLRQQSVANHDAVSKRTLRVALDISKVLTPQQRADLAAKLKQRGERGRPGADNQARAPR